MFKATLFSIVLTLAAGPSISVFCQAFFCDPLAAAQSGCHDQSDGSRTSIQATDDCQDGLTEIAVIKERFRTVSPDLNGHAVPVAAYHVNGLAAGACLSHARGLAPPTHDRPLSTPLRI